MNIKKNIWALAAALLFATAFTNCSGWTEVEAPSITIAVQAFTAFHRAVNGITACSDIYTESEFRKTGMLESGNFGAKTREKITITRELF